MCSFLIKLFPYSCFEASFFDVLLFANSELSKALVSRFPS
jgi:hypothetical protein